MLLAVLLHVTDVTALSDVTEKLAAAGVHKVGTASPEMGLAALIVGALLALIMFWAFEDNQ